MVGVVRAVREHLVPRGRAKPDHVLQRKPFAVARFVEKGSIVGARIAFVQKERTDVGFLQHEAQFVGAVCRIDVDQHHSGARRGMLNQDPLQAVARPDAGAVVRA